VVAINNKGKDRTTRHTSKLTTHKVVTSLQHQQHGQLYPRLISSNITSLNRFLSKLSKQNNPSPTKVLPMQLSDFAPSTSFHTVAGLTEE
jgi:hypothetical protein